MKPDVQGAYLTSFCNKPHRLLDGKPIGHECYVLPPEALAAEKEGRVHKALCILSVWKRRRVHRGLPVPASTAENTE